MKYTKIISTLLLVTTLSFQTIQAQQKTVPSSGVINAAQMLDDIRILSADDMQGRKVGTPGGIKAREYVLRRFKDSGLKSFGGTFLKPFNYNAQIIGTNVVGYIKGSQNANKYIVVTAHYDHLGIINQEIFNGADDNASGTSALFALAAYFKKNTPANSIMFIAFDSEEFDLQGSRKFVASPPVKKEAMIMNVNLDMVAHNDINELYVAGTYHYPFLKPYLKEVAATATIKLLFGHDSPDLGDQDWTDQSDHFPFHEAKIPFVYFGVEDHRDYHQPTDDFERINQKFYVNAVETILEAVKKFDANLAQIERQKATLTKK